MTTVQEPPRSRPSLREQLARLAGAGEDHVDDPAAGAGDRPPRGAGTAGAAAGTSGPSIDPRMWQRRVEVARQTSRHRVRVAVGVLGAMTLVAVAVGVAHSPLLGARHLRVVGGAPAAVLAAAGIRSGEPLIDISPGASEARLERLPAIATAVVSRHWPQSITVTVTDRVAVAQVVTTSGVDLVDVTGRIVGQRARAESRLPELIGAAAPGRPGTWLAAAPGASAPSGPDADLSGLLAAPGSPTSAALAFAASVERTEARVGLGRQGSRLTSLTVSSHGEVSAASGSTAIVLGGTSDLAAKAAAVVAFLRAVPLGDLAAVDFTVPDRPTGTVRSS